MSDGANEQSSPPAEAVRGPQVAFAGLQSRFLRRSFFATLVTIALVGMTVAVYWSPMWAAQYAGSALWSVVFLTLTPLVFKALLFDNRPLLGLVLLMGKLIWMGAVLVVALGPWGGKIPWQPWALVAGASTPLAVVVLRTLGSMMDKPPQGDADNKVESQTR